MITGIMPMEPKKKLFSILEELKNFAFKGNVVDLAVGVIIGAAFGKSRGRLLIRTFAGTPDEQRHA